MGSRTLTLNFNSDFVFTFFRVFATFVSVLCFFRFFFGNAPHTFQAICFASCANTFPAFVHVCGFLYLDVQLKEPITNDNRALSSISMALELLIVSRLLFQRPGLKR